METISIPGLQKEVSRIGLGTWAIGGWMWGGTDEQDSVDTIAQAIDLGINLIDAAPVYGFGLVEEMLGKIFQSYGNRDQIYIATKGGLGWKNGKVFRDTRKEAIISDAEASLKRLQTDYIDIYIVHWPDSKVPLAETAEAMNQLFKQGKIRAIGVSNFSVEQMEEFQKTAPIHVLQPPFNLFEQEIVNKELSYCLKMNIATLGYGSLCRGLLSGKMEANRIFKGDDVRKMDPKFREPLFGNYLMCANLLKEWIEKTHHRSLSALAIRWALDKGISVALWGARRPDQFSKIEEIWGWKLNDTDFEAIDEIIRRSIVKPLGPQFMSPPS